MTETPLVTVITPTYNRADYLVETIESILSQNYPNLEYIVLDDGSTDNSIDILKGYEGRLIWDSHPNMGEQRTVNKGFQMAKGKYITVINSDDPVLPNFLKTVVEFMEAHPDILVGYPDWILIDADSKPIKTTQTAEYSYLKMLRRHVCIPGPGTVIRREALDYVGGRDERLRFSADMDFWYRLGLYGPFARIPHTLATFRRHPNSATVSQKGILMARQHIQCVKNVYNMPNLPPKVQRIRAEAFRNAYRVNARMLRLNGNIKWALWYEVRALWAYPLRPLQSMRKRLWIFRQRLIQQ